MNYETTIPTSDMKKSLPILSVAGIALLLACASCSDDVVNQGITLPEGVPSEVTLGYDNEIKTIPVNLSLIHI